VYPADRTVPGEPALAGGVMDHPAACRALRPSYPLEDQPAHAGPNQISGGSVHSPILSPGPTRGARSRQSKRMPTTVYGRRQARCGSE